MHGFCRLSPREDALLNLFSVAISGKQVAGDFQGKTVLLMKRLRIVDPLGGIAGIYPRLGPTMEWDTAAGQAIAAASGAWMVQYPGDVPLVYNKPDLRNPWFVVTAK